jgi:hypothetical protein
MNRTLSKAQYKALFTTTTSTPSDTASFADRALAAALDTRKFEISLYWQRTAYLWAMIAAAFAGYFAVAAEKTSLAALCLACVGFVLSVAWYRLNQGSKFWQENWEQHVALLEHEHFGPLFSTVLQKRRVKGHIWSLHPSAPISVSRVNLYISLYIAFVWLVLVADQLLPFDFAAPFDWYAVSVVVGSLLVCLALWKSVGTVIELVTIDNTP